MLAAAEEDFLGFRGFEFHRIEFGAFVRAVTEWLVGGLAAGTPEIGFARLDFDGEGAFLCDLWAWHVGWLQCWVLESLRCLT
jgi:hypothetical protein